MADAKNVKRSSNCPPQTSERPQGPDRAVLADGASKLLGIVRTSFYLEYNSGQSRRLPGRRVRITLPEINRYLAKKNKA